MYPNTFRKKIYQFPSAAVENSHKYSGLKTVQMCYLMIPEVINISRLKFYDCI